MTDFDKELEGAMALLGYTDFRSPEQEYLVRTIMAGNDALGIMPTGSGKSAGFILPTVARGLKTLVISPLISLMADQVQKLREWGISAFAIHSDTDGFDVIEAMLALMATPGKPGFLYVSPEMLGTERFRKRFKNFKPDLIAVDEAHCVSTWGDTFRPSYLRIREIAEWFGSPQCVAFSATIDEKIANDVEVRLPLKPGFRKVEMDPFRPNLAIKVTEPGARELRTVTRNLKARQELFKLIKAEKTGAVIVYCYSRNRTGAEFANIERYARRLGYYPIMFHAEIMPEDKERALYAFTTAKRPLVICTSAFGMGIDRPDVRLVIHFEPPNTLVDYAQQIGRAGRDGLPASCVTFYDPRRVNNVDSKIRVSIPDVGFVEKIHARLVKAWRKSKGQLTLTGFQYQLDVLADKEAVAPDLYKGRASRSISILRRAGYIREESGKVIIRRLTRGSRRYLKLLELTEMTLRRQVRETERLKRFFEDEKVDQKLLWQIIGE